MTAFEGQHPDDNRAPELDEVLKIKRQSPIDYHFTMNKARHTEIMQISLLLSEWL